MNCGMCGGLKTSAVRYYCSECLERFADNPELMRWTQRIFEHGFRKGFEAKSRGEDLEKALY